MLASTNPVHSLSGLLKQDVFGKETQVTGKADFTKEEWDTVLHGPTTTATGIPPR